MLLPLIFAILRLMLSPDAAAKILLYVMLISCHADAATLMPLSCHFHCFHCYAAAVAAITALR